MPHQRRATCALAVSVESALKELKQATVILSHAPDVHGHIYQANWHSTTAHKDTIWVHQPPTDTMCGHKAWPQWQQRYRRSPKLLHAPLEPANTAHIQTPSCKGWATECRLITTVCHKGHTETSSTTALPALHRVQKSESSACFLAVGVPKHAFSASPRGHSNRYVASQACKLIHSEQHCCTGLTIDGSAGISLLPSAKAHQPEL